MRIDGRPQRAWTLCLAAALTLALSGLVATAPSRPAGAQSETFFGGSAGGGSDPESASSAPCPIAHCNPHLDGRESLTSSGSVLSIPVSTVPLTPTTYTPAHPLSFSIGLACTTGMTSTITPADQVECSGTQPITRGPFVYNLTASGRLSSTALTLNWTSALYSTTQSPTCTVNTAFGMDAQVARSAPLFSNQGYSYLSDTHSMVKYNPTGTDGLGTCAWGWANPARVALISWNAVYLPPNNQPPHTYPGGWYLVGQGHAGPVLLVDLATGQIISTLLLSDDGGVSDYATYNTIAAVDTPAGARLYDSTGSFGLRVAILSQKAYLISR